MATLTSEEKRLAEAEAEKVLNETFGNLDAIKFPIDLGTILDRNSLILKKGDFKDPNISGAFNRDESTIYISDQETSERQNFTVAHELGHFKLHKEKTTDIFYRKQMWEFGDGYQNEETQANWFAANLLMPAEAVKRMWKVTKNASELARFFGVSKAAMYFRLKDLGLLAD